jgi:hypothetical protein
MKPLAQNKGVLVDEPEYFGSRCSSDEAIRAFPELPAELAKDAELLHVQMGTLASQSTLNGDIAPPRRPMQCCCSG